MFSLHIDTARTWRGGQNQVLLTVNGLRAIGQRAALVAHPDGELRRRAAEGLELDPDRAADRDGPLRRVAAVARHQAAGARRHPRARPARRRDGRAGAVDRHRRHAERPRAGARRSRGASTFTSRATRSRGGSTGRSTASSPRPRRSGRCSSPTACPPIARSPCTRASTSSTSRAAPPVNVHEAFWLPHGAPVVGNVAALVPHKGQRHLIDAAHLVVQRGARRALRDPRRRRAARAPRTAGARAPSREARAAARLPHRRARLHQGVRPVRDELGHRRARHVAARRDGVRAADRRDARRAAFPKSSRTA